MLNEEKLKLYLENDLNVLLEGPHGVGKTAVIKQVFEGAGLKWKYFSASTMDPWVDFIGVPKSVVDKNGQETLELIKPKEFANDEVEAIFFDEFNRAPAKVMNAVMELIQFKSINGRKFNNLKVVWAAVNPHDEDNTYQVEKLDPAVRDRFHIFINVPAQLDAGYLLKTHGSLAKPFMKWWGELPAEIKTDVSPRRLDYAIKIYSIGGDLKDCLPKESNIPKLYADLKEAQESIRLEKLSKSSDAELKKFFTLENTMKYAPKILGDNFDNDFISKMVKYFNKDYVEASIQSTNPDNLSYALAKKAIDDKEFFASLSDKSQTIVNEAKKTQDSIQVFMIDSVTKDNIQKSTVAASKFGAKTFITKMLPVFESYLKTIKKQNNTDINPFFEAMFSARDGAKDIRSQIYSILGTQFNNMSTSTPSNDNNALAFMGLTLNFALKNAYLDNSPAVKKIEGFVKAIINTSEKTRKTRNGDGRLIMFAFEEANWKAIKSVVEKGNFKGIISTPEYKAYDSSFKTKDSKEFIFKTPGTYREAQNIFAKKEGFQLGSMVQPSAPVKTRKRI